jgi:hypothetical protein
VVALIVLAAASGVLSSLGDIGSQIGLQLLVYAALDPRADRMADHADIYCQQPQAGRRRRAGRI